MVINHDSFCVIRVDIHLLLCCCLVYIQKYTKAYQVNRIGALNGKDPSLWLSIDNGTKHSLIFWRDKILSVNKFPILRNL